MADLIDHMTSRFLQWKLPDDFAPDGGVTFTAVRPHGPVGTNLLTYAQAKAMVIYMLDGAPLAALPAQGVRVKPLEWTAREDFNGLHEACGADGLYRNVWDQKNGTWVYEGDPTTNPPTQARFPTLDAAKAAAQADYERRIRAALAAAVPADLAEAGRVLEGVTEGPWRVDGEPWNQIVWSGAGNRVCFMSHSNGLDDARDVATARFIAWCREGVPALIATVTAQAARIEALMGGAGAASQMALDYIARAEAAETALAPAEAGGVDVPAALSEAQEAARLALWCAEAFKDKLTEAEVYQIKRVWEFADCAAKILAEAGGVEALAEFFAKGGKPMEQVVAELEAPAPAETGGVEVDWGADIGREVLPAPVEALAKAAEAWEAFKAATTTYAHFNAVERLDALFALIPKDGEKP